MALSITWDASFEAAPPDNETKRLGASRIRDHKVAIRERMQQAGINWKDSLTDDGKLAVGVSSLTPSALRVWKSNFSDMALDITDTYVRPGTSVEIQDENGDPLTQRRHMVAWGVGGDVEIGRNQTVAIEAAQLDTGETASLTEVRALLLTAPTGAALTVDLERCLAANDPTDGNFSTVATVTVSDGSYSGTVAPVGVTISPNDKLRINVTQVGGTEAGEDLAVEAVLTY